MKSWLRFLYSNLQPKKKSRPDAYPRLVASLKRNHDLDKAMELAVGGNFEAIGMIERDTLIHFGLKKDSYLIDVGCGSGRLALPLSAYLPGKYLGTDVVPDLVDYARKLVNRPDWRFELVKDLRIPEGDHRADMVCFFSVFTHLLHEHSYKYLQEAKRVLKPDGKIVFSFLDFSVSSHWDAFQSALNDLEQASHLNVFIGKDAIAAWAMHLDLKVECIMDGDKPYVPLSSPVVFDNGGVLEGLGTIGQSVCVMSPK